jgi:hypothetical protein
MKIEIHDRTPIVAPSNVEKNKQSLAQGELRMKNQAKAARIVAVALLTGGLGCVGVAAYAATHAEELGMLFQNFSR